MSSVAVAAVESMEKLDCCALFDSVFRRVYKLYLLKANEGTHGILRCFHLSTPRAGQSTTCDGYSFCDVSSV